MTEPERARVFAEIVEAFLDRVQADGTALGTPAPRPADLRERAGLILEEVHRRLTGTAAPERPLRDVGASRADAGVHPSSSLAAAGQLFATALPRLHAYYRGQGADTTSEDVALCLHETIQAVLVQAAVSYVDALLDRLSSAHLEERRRIARDLHDRTSHGIGAAVQGVDLALLLMSRGQAPDPLRLSRTRDVLRETLDEVRAMATDLRDAVGDRSLLTALIDHAEVLLSDEAGIELRVEGDEPEPELPEFAREEAYLILREALRNAVVHGHAKTHIRMGTWSRDGHFRAVVADDGIGFDPALVVAGQTVGLASMQERAEGIGGTVSVTAAPGAGVVVQLLIPQQALSTGLAGS